MIKQKIILGSIASLLLLSCTPDETSETTNLEETQQENGGVMKSMVFIVLISS